MALNAIVRLWDLVKTVKKDAIILYYAWRHPETPSFIKVMLVMLVAYVFSPIDIIPDYLPIIGIADDVTIVTAAVLFLTQRLPLSVRMECERDSAIWRKRMPWVLSLFVLFVLMWIAIALIGIVQVVSFLR